MATANSVKEAIESISNELDLLRSEIFIFRENGKFDDLKLTKQISNIDGAVEEAKSEIDDLALEIDQIQNTIQELDSRIKEVNI
ncbi:hypothetical protein NNC19_07355 [Clostridium sp. SHJSY1]|uniref:hypothetical protein n=1 Tax=Clostridium sp. SHJSY1 TaxID=2942483 RepID=UPI0028741604|nr:hypothetical protein [Clostridium sp. SHJSY1]MDS0525491.1 hypothetical protein [Clostridium sp. SHJSY1]